MAQADTEVFSTLKSADPAGNEAGAAADVATKADLAGLESKLIRWMVGIFCVASIAAAAAVACVIL